MSGEVGTSDDYKRLAAISEETGIPFETLAERWERGVRGPELTRAGYVRRAGLPEAEGTEWLTTEQVAELLGISTMSMYDLASKRRGQILLKLSRSRIAMKDGGATTIGYHRLEILHIKRIRTQLNVSAFVAMKVFVALKEGTLG